MGRKVNIPKRITGYKFPDSEEDLDTLANSVLTYAKPHIEGASAPSTGSGTGGGSVAEPVEAVEPWPDISASSWTAFKAAYAAWGPAYAACKGAHPRRDTEAKNKALVALRFTLAGLLERGLLLEPRTAKDAAAMGCHLLDATATVLGVMIDVLIIDSLTNDPIPGSHTHIIRYHIKQNTHSTRVIYYQAVFQVYLQGAGDPPPVLNSERGWSKGYVSLNAPFELRHEPGDVGKTAHYRVRWVTEGGVKGPWSMASAKVW
jgi:hypothetical protein